MFFFQLSTLEDTLKVATVDPFEANYTQGIPKPVCDP